MISEKLSFPGSSGAGLAARLDLPAGRPTAYALFAHCFTCSKDIYAANRISRMLVEEGFGLARFDFTGIGASEGDFAHTNFSSNIEDLELTAAYLSERGMAPALLIGHSLGGAAVLAAAAAIPSIRAVATLGAPFDPAHVGHLFRSQRAEIESSGEAEVLIAGRPFRVRRQFLEDIEAQDQRARIGALKAALLVMHAPLDAIVGIDNAAEIFQAARHPKSFVSLDGADHLLSRRRDADYAARVIAAWASRYHDQPVPAQPAASDGTVTVTEAGEGKFRQTITVGTHRLIGDEPVAVGGDDAGPGPYDYLLAALGTCTSMTIRMYADRKKMPLRGVSLGLSHSKVHAADCTDCVTRDSRIDEIERHIRLDGPLDTDQRRRLIEIADRCPVHRTLTGEIKIRTHESREEDI